MDYESGNYNGLEIDLILYSKKGYKKSDLGYINIDINHDRKLDNAPVVAVENGKIIHGDGIKYADMTEFGSDFVDAIKENNTVDTLVKYMHIFKISFSGQPGEQLKEFYRQYFIYEKDYAELKKNTAILFDAEKKYYWKYQSSF